jgi:hypothetical protein
MENVSTAEMTVGIDLGDRQSRVCILSAEGEVREEGWIATTEAALVPRFRAMARARIVMEVGTHSPWVSRLLQAAGHEVIVANPRQLRLNHALVEEDGPERRRAAGAPGPGRPGAPQACRASPQGGPG